MNYFKSLFNSTPQQQAKSSVEKYLSSIELNNKGLALTLTFQYLLNNAMTKCIKPQLFLKQLTLKLLTTKNVSATVKLFTVIHNAIYETDYRKQYLECLQDLSAPTVEDQQQKKWFSDFSHCYSNYLRKIPSVCDVYLRAKRAQPGQTQQNQYLIQMFRIINQIGILFPSICVFTNTIGRYYLTSYPQFAQLYRMINKQITMLYNYLKLLIQQILESYRKFNIQQLRCFLKTIPQIELICDKMQDLLLNKYFKGKAIKGKIYFKEEKVQQLHYYIQYEVQGKQLNSSQLNEMNKGKNSENKQISENKYKKDQIKQ